MTRSRRQRYADSIARRACRLVPAWPLLAVLLAAAGCAVYTEPRAAADGAPLPGPGEEWNLFVFFDGTANDAKGTTTNVRQLFEEIIELHDPATFAYYIEGVGNTRNPITGMLFGYGMEKRLGLAYEFLSSHYRPGDKIYIFGFSRGAHQARALAGLLAYSGLPAPGQDPVGGRGRNRIREITKDHSDVDFEWDQWRTGQEPFLAAQISERMDGLRMQPVTVELVGVWDTVPGSFFKDFPVGACKEAEDGKKGDRYKSDSYPPLRVIAHAVSSDEKRSRFRPLFLCEAMTGNPEVRESQVQERWFPGAHSDVGGGYDVPEASDLSNFSYNWMLDILAASYRPAAALERKPEDPRGLAHSSIDSFPGNLFSRCEDRVPPHNGRLDHPSVDRRQGSAPVQVVVGKWADPRPYPESCRRN